MPEFFHFLRPAWLVAIPLAIPFLVWRWHRLTVSSDWAQVCEPHLLRHLTSGEDRRAVRWPLGLVAIGWLVSCVALAGPTWERVPQDSFVNTARSVLVLGLAPSLDARDVAPSRLARSRHKLLDAVNRLDGGTIGLVVYREEAFATSPLTDDAQVLRELIPLLETSLAPGRVVQPARGLEEAFKLLEPVGTAGAQVLLVSDGADDDPAATRRAAASLARAGARVSVLGVAGSDSNLASVAKAGGGAFAALQATDADLAVLLQTEPAMLGTRLTKTDIQTDAWRDMGVWLVWIPLLLAPLAFRKGWVVAALALALAQLPTSPAQAGVRDWFERPDQQGATAFEHGEFAASAERFEDPAWKAAARYKAGDFSGAAGALENQTDPTSHYNRGNALAKMGRLEEALAAYDMALASDPENRDATFNRDLVKKILESQKPPPPSKSAEPSEASSDGDPSDTSSTAEVPPEPATTDPEDPEPGSNTQGQHTPDPSAANAAMQDREGAEPNPESPGEAAEAAKSETASAEAAASGPNGDRSGVPGEPGIEESLPPDPALPGTGSHTFAPTSPREQAAQQWMSRLPDDPGGLLREKIRRDYVRKLQARRKGAR